MNRKLFLFIKRSADLFFAFLFLILLSPVFLSVSIIILFFDGWPIFFTQERVGKNWKMFKINKFRTMPTNAPKFAIGLDSKDSRTKTGAFLRKVNIDELPQLINILIGQMSFVGPRPEINKFAKLYRSRETKIFDYKPGLTSPASLVYTNEDIILKKFSNKTAAYLKYIVPKKIAIDLAYFCNETILGDLSVVFKTIGLIFKVFFR